MNLAAPQSALPRAWYSARVEDFLGHSTAEIIGRLTLRSHAVEPAQRDAWGAQIDLLKGWLQGRSGTLLLEFEIPRMGLRADAVLLLAGCVVIIEFKVGERSMNRADRSQAWEYALDTKNFHEPSHALPIVPLLVLTAASVREPPPRRYAPDRVCEPVPLAPSQVPAVLDELSAEFPARMDHVAWIDGRYRPTPTIIEAARHLYAGHRVEAITRAEAGARNLADTAGRLEALILRARERNEKIICFVTGVPGAGKTLVGLNVATTHRDDDDTHAVFLSGNGPLVALLREALTRDDVARRKLRGERRTKAEAAKPVKAFIQNVHHFRDEALRDAERPPVDRVVIFDEAQRAWNLAKTSRFMRQRKGIPGFDRSEPEFLIEYLDRHEGWAVIVCLVGGGQEIHTGEAGIGAWIEACVTRFPHWHLCISDRLLDAEYGAGGPLRLARERQRTGFLSDLHLTVSLRSFRAEKVSAFVKALLDGERDAAVREFEGFRERYPIVITRNLDAAKRWVRTRARGNERYGLLASSKAMRLKPHAIEVRLAADPIHYFLHEPEDVRSSWYLEDCATEFQVQGLELDWACVTWDADLRRTDQGWSHHDFRGSRWQNVRNADSRRYLENAYRVLLTRARQGMAIFVPPGDAADHTRPPGYYAGTYAYLRSLGLPEYN
jgi:hypothetical protein